MSSTGPTITFGMAVFDDFSGAWFTVQALRLYQEWEGEVLLVDNNPGSAHGRQTREFVEAWGKGGKNPIRYHPYTERTGTAAPRDRVFELATGEVVCCLDPHVLLRTGAAAALAQFFRDRPGCSDLVQGPMLYDDLHNHATHFSDEWRGEMWGTWQQAWRSPQGEVVEARRAADGMTDLVDPVRYQPAAYRDKDGQPLRPPHGGHAAALAAAGFTPAAAGFTPAAAPFEIGAMGLGQFACRKDAWPGFHKAFKGFGGEEWYVHEKFRRLGRRVWCLPAAAWAHRFGRPDGVPYPLAREDKVRNYALGHLELGLPLDRLRAHFVTEVGTPADRFDQLVAEARALSGLAPAAAAAVAAPADRPDDLAEWAWRGGSWAPVGRPADRSLECKPPRAPGAEEGETLLTRCAKVPPAQAAQAPPDQAAAQPAKAGGCGCGGKGWTPQQLEAAKAQSAKALDRQYALAPVPLLLEYATGAGRVVDFSDDRGPTFVALLKAAPACLVSHARNTQAQMEGRETPAGGGTLRLSGLDAAAAPPEACDLLVLDEARPAEAVYQALRRHAPLCSGRIVLAGTETRGEHFDGGPGLLPAVRRFLKEEPAWTVKEHRRGDEHKAGYLVLTRLEADKKPLPPLWKQGWNALKASWRAGQLVTGGLGPLAGTEAQERRLALCTTCTSRNGETCGECGCQLSAKTSWGVSNCPLGVWSEEPDEQPT